MDEKKFENLVLDEEEQEILDALHEGRIKVEPPSEMILLAAKETMKNGIEPVEIRQKVARTFPMGQMT